MDVFFAVKMQSVVGRVALHSEFSCSAREWPSNQSVCNRELNSRSRT